MKTKGARDQAKTVIRVSGVRRRPPPTAALSDAPGADGRQQPLQSPTSQQHYSVFLLVDLCLQRSIQQLLRSDVVLPYGVRRLIKDYLCQALTDDNLRQAATLWCHDPLKATMVYGHIELWDVTHVTRMDQLFSGCTSFNDAIGRWDVSHVVSMDEMFHRATLFNQPLHHWNVSCVQSFRRMFDGAASFNQPLLTWDVQAAVDMTAMFAKATAFNQPLHTWRVQSVQSMARMFYGAKTFNQPLQNWDITAVRDMRSMFSGASRFNQPLANWDVSEVQHLQYIFQSTPRFNQAVDLWTENGWAMWDVDVLFDGPAMSKAAGT